MHSIPSLKKGLPVLAFLIVFSCVQSQDINEILAVQEIDTMLYSGPKDNRINWVIQNRGNSFDDKEDFINAYRNDLLLTFDPNHQSAQTPYAQYRNFFNLYTFWWPDALDDNNGWNFNIIKQLRDMVFLPWATEDRGWATFFSSTKHGGGGGAGLNRDARVGDGKMYGMGFETFLHEFGHTMPGLLDEYSASGSWSNGECWETGNSTGKMAWEDIPWRLWVDKDTPLPTPYTAEYLDAFGAFEGAMTNYFGCHRPTARGCFMGAGGFGEDYGLVLCAPCIQRVICYLYRYVDVIENPMPAENDIEVSDGTTVTFSAEVIKPEPNTQKYQWILNGALIAEDIETLDITFEACASYELKFTVYDTTDLVRYDPKFENTYPKPFQERIWHINSTDVSSQSLSVVETVRNDDCTSSPTGMVEFEISGGQMPYQIYLEGVLQANPVENLAEGAYAFDIIDANGCHIQEDVIIEGRPLLDPYFCTEYFNDSWWVTVENDNYDPQELQYLWAHGDASQSVIIDGEGHFQVTVYTSELCGVSKSIQLEHVDKNIEVSHKAFSSTLNSPTGKIYLDVDHGRPPYSVTWYQKLIEDLSDTDTDNIISSGTTWDHYPEYAFDDERNTKWLHAVANDAFIGYVFDKARIVNAYAITSADDVPERDPRNWEFQASTDGTNWEVLDEQSDHQFDSRYERRVFLIENEDRYNYYRLYIKDNYGDIATQIQELELIGVDDLGERNYTEEADNQFTRTALSAGMYYYTVKDENRVTVMDSVYVGMQDTGPMTGISVIQHDACSVTIESPLQGYDYYWFADRDGLEIIGIGTIFNPPYSGNFYVAAVDINTGTMSEPIKGFAVTVAEQANIEIMDDSFLQVIDPDADYAYHWYDADVCDGAIHIGNDFTPSDNGAYYVAAHPLDNSRSSLNPALIDGLVIRMDAADLNGDGIVDNPAPETSSLYGWNFTNGNRWADNNWYAFRSNYQNGHGVADFATIWLQRLQEPEYGYQTILMAYEENPITFPERAPFEGLSSNIPRHTDASQLYSNNAPDHTLSGTTYLNGHIVDPLSTANPLEFCILGTVMTEISNNEIYYTDTHWEGKIGEILLYDRALSQDEMEGASEYLRKKWISIADLASPRKLFTWDGNMVSVSDLEVESNKIYASPNPGNGRFEIQGIDNISLVEVFNQAGTALPFSSHYPGYIDITNLPGGIYFARVKTNQANKTYIIKLIKM